MHEHAPDGVEGDQEEVAEEEEGFGSEGREEGDGSGDGLTTEFEVLEASGLEDFEVGVLEKEKRGEEERESVPERAKGEEETLTRREKKRRQELTVGSEKIVEGDRERVDDGGKVLPLPVPSLNSRSVGGPVLEVGEFEGGRENSGKVKAVVEGDGHSSCENEKEKRRKIMSSDLDGRKKGKKN